MRRLFCLLAAAFLASSASAQPNVYGSSPAPSGREEPRAPAPALTLPSAPNLPDLGDSSQTEITPQVERRIGESIMREIRRDPAYVDDPEIRDYVQSIGYRLVAASGETRQEFEFFVVRDKTVNAFAMPGGFIGVHTGLLLAAQTESEFASVLGARDRARPAAAHGAPVRRAEQGLEDVAGSRWPSRCSRPAPIRRSRRPRSSAARRRRRPVYLNHSRDFEREADRVGYQLLDGAGFDTAGMPGFFERLQKATRLYENNAPTYLRTHPLTSERIADMQNRQAGAPYRQRPDSIEFQLVRAKVRATDGTPAEAVAFFRTALAEKRFANEAAVHYGYAIAAARAKDWKTAEYGDRRGAQARAAAADVRDARRADQARRAATWRAPRRSSPRRAPLSPIRWRSGSSTRRCCSGSGANKEAVAVLDELAKGRLREPRVYQMIAKSYAALGQRTQQHRALAEGYLLQGSLPAAIEQLQFAQAAADTDFYTLSAIDARLRDLKAQQAQAN